MASKSRNRVEGHSKRTEAASGSQVVCGEGAGFETSYSIVSANTGMPGNAVPQPRQSASGAEGVSREGVASEARSNGRAAIPRKAQRRR